MYIPTSGLDYVSSLFGVTPMELGLIIGEPVDDVTDWLQGEPVPENLIPDIAMELHIPAWVLGEDAIDIFEKRGWRMPSFEFSSADKTGLNLYWGNVGLKAPGMDQSIWIPLSEDEHCGFSDDTRMDVLSHIVFEGMGMSSFIIFPDRMHSLKLVQADQAPIIGDWDIAPGDPVEGLPVSYLSLLEYPDILEFPINHLNAKNGFNFNSWTETCGGADRVDELRSSVEVFFTDGSRETFFIPLMDNRLATVLKSLRRDTVETAGDAGVPQFIPLKSDGSTFLIPTKLISMLRFPSILLLP